MKDTYKDPYDGLKACNRCKVLARTTCDIQEMILTTEFTINGVIGFKKCPFREMASRLINITPKAGKHYEEANR